MTAPCAPGGDRVRGYCGLCIARCGTVATWRTAGSYAWIPIPHIRPEQPFAPRAGRLPNWSTTRSG
jgi:hypothetical protein